MCLVFISSGKRACRKKLEHFPKNVADYWLRQPEEWVCARGSEDVDAQSTRTAKLVPKSARDETNRPFRAEKNLSLFITERQCLSVSLIILASAKFQIAPSSSVVFEKNLKLQLPAFVPNRKTAVAGEPGHQLKKKKKKKLELIAEHCRFVRLDDNNSMSHPQASEHKDIGQDCSKSCCLGRLFWKFLGSWIWILPCLPCASPNQTLSQLTSREKSTT